MNERFAAKIAEAYSQHSEKYASILEPILQPMADEIADRAGLSGGERVLDLATGTGLTARIMAGAGAAVTGMDISPGMLARARTLSSARIPFVVGDAHRVPFRNHSFDMVACGISLSHFSDVSVALGEILRVLRPGGRFVTSAWGRGGRNPSREAAVAVRNRFLEDKELTFEGAFGKEVWEDAPRGCEILRQAGFVDVGVTTMQLSGAYRNSAEAIETALAWPIACYRIDRLDAADQRKLRDETAAAMLEVDDLRWHSEIHIYQAARSVQSTRSRAGPSTPPLR